MELLWRAQAVHREANPGYRVQLASLLSVKTGGCEEDCAYCPQSLHHSADVAGRPELEVEPVLARARAAKAAGAHRFCMGWAWREIRDGAPFEAMLADGAGVRELGLEACVTAGMLTDSQAERLAEAGLTAYNHNLDTSPEHYDRIITTRSYQERLETLQRVRQAGIDVLRRHHRHGRGPPATGPGCCRCWPTSTPTPRACRSTPWWPWRARRWRGSPPWIRSSWCGWWPPPAS
jgi:biotin synthase